MQYVITIDRQREYTTDAWAHSGIIPHNVQKKQLKLFLKCSSFVISMHSLLLNVSEVRTRGYVSGYDW
jgi:hypothetical protein